MQNYHFILFTLDKSAKPTAKANALLKVASGAHDSELARLCRESARLYLNHLKLGHARQVPDNKIGILPRTNAEWREMLRKSNRELRDYIEQRLAERKPAWQVEAERRGWRPPNEK